MRTFYNIKGTNYIIRAEESDAINEESVIYTSASDGARISAEFVSELVENDRLLKIPDVVVIDREVYWGEFNKFAPDAHSFTVVNFNSQRSFLDNNLIAAALAYIYGMFVKPTEEELSDEVVNLREAAEDAAISYMFKETDPDYTVNGLVNFINEHGTFPDGFEVSYLFCNLSMNKFAQALQDTADAFVDTASDAASIVKRKS